MADPQRSGSRGVLRDAITTCTLLLLVWSGTLRLIGAETTTEGSATPPDGRKVTVPPLIEVEPIKMIAFRVGESLELPCVASGEPQPLYSWKMNDKDFDPSGNDGRIAIQPGVGTLIFARPLERDEAIYQCLATNQVGVALTVKIDLRLAYLDPFQTTGTREYRPRLGESLTLTCVPPRSFPRPDIFWATVAQGEGFIPIDLTDRVTMDPIGNLHFTNIEAVDYQQGRTYACFVQNKVMRSIQQGEYARVIPQGDIPIYMPPEILWQSPTHQVSLRGEIWRVKCVFSGNPTPRVDWIRVDAEMPQGRWRQESFGQELVIENIQFEDVGKYECQGINDDTSVPIRRSFDLAIEAAPFWIKRPQPFDGAEGDTAVFECEADGIPEPVNFWYINGIPISNLPDDPRREVEQKRLTYRNLTKDDAMVVQCNATNKHGYQYTNAYMNVLTEPPIILEPPLEDQKAAESQTINLTCKVFGSPKPLVIWRKGSEQLTGGRYRVLDSGDLEITDVMLVDAGVYTCTATNIFDTVTATGSLIVRRRTEIQTAPLDVMIHQGMEVKLTCTATTDPEEVQNLRIDWMKDGGMIDYNLAQRVFKNDMDNSLTISGTLSLDTGKYTCIASNGIDEASAGADLIVQAPPDPPSNVHIDLCEPEKKNATIGWQPGRENYAPILNFIIQFNTSFNPDTWYDIATNISQNVRYMRVSLSPYANYSFRVLARNKIGLSNPSIHTSDRCALLKPERPDKNPENVMGEGDTPDNLIIFWTPMSPIEFNGQKFRYVVNWKRADLPNSEQDTITIDDPSLWFHVVQETVPTYKPYQIRVKAQNEIGDAWIEAKWHIGYSGEGEPRVAPSNVQVVDGTVTDTEATLQWEQVDLDPEVLQGFFRGYRVQFARSSEWPENIRDVDFIFNRTYQYPRPPERNMRYRRDLPGQVEVTLTHLPPNSMIKAQVRVLNKYYAGPASTEIEFQTEEGEPGPPAMVDVIVKGSTHFELVWLPPVERNGELTGYQIYYQTVIDLNLGRMKFRDPIYDPEARQARLTGLEPETYYRVYLSAMTARGKGEPIFFDMETAPPGPPSAPTFAVTSLNETYANVTWEPSTGSNPGSIFYVEYRVRNFYHWKSSPDEYLYSYIELFDLEPGTHYQVRVVAKNGEGLEAPAEYQELRTHGNPTYSFHLASSVWFYGIWIALVCIIALLILFFFAKRHRDFEFIKKEAKIENRVRQMQAEEFANQMGLDGDMGPEYMNTSQDGSVYSDDRKGSLSGDDDVYYDDYDQIPPYNGTGVPPYNGYSSDTKKPYSSNGTPSTSSSKKYDYNAVPLHSEVYSDMEGDVPLPPEPAQFVPEGYSVPRGSREGLATPHAARPGSRSHTPEPQYSGSQYSLNRPKPTDTFV